MTFAPALARARRALFLLLAATCAAGAAAPTTVTPPPIAAKAFHLLDTLSGRTLAASADDRRYEPASLTKMMTAYVAFAAMAAGEVDPQAQVAVSAEAARAPGARMFLAAGDKVAVIDLVRGMAVLSANDAAVALAEAIAGSEAAFAQRMNATAKKLGLSDTTFANATGRPQPGHLTTARDMATLAARLVRDFPERYRLFSGREVAHKGMSHANTNRLLWIDETVDGVKTGFTESAGYNLAASARRGERRLVAVVLGAQTDSLRVSEAQKLLNFGFLAYDTRRLYRKGDRVAAPEVFKGTRETVPLGFDRDVWVTLPRERFDGLTAVLETRQPFVAPLAAGEKAGIMRLMRDNAPLAEIPVVALEDVPVAGFLSRGWDSLRLLLR